MAPTTTSRAAISRAHELSLSNDGYNAIGALPHTGPPNSLLASKKSGEPYIPHIVPTVRVDRAPLLSN